MIASIRGNCFRCGAKSARLVAHTHPARGLVQTCDKHGAEFLTHFAARPSTYRELRFPAPPPRVEPMHGE